MSGNKKFPRTHAGRLAADMVLRYYTHDVARDSAALTYYLLFAIFPLLIFISTLLGLLELDVAYITSVLEPLLPADVVDVVRSYLEYVSANQSRQLLWFSLIFSIWFPMRASGCLMHSLRKAFGRSAPESLWRSQLRILLFTVWLIVVIAVTLVLVVVGRSVLEFVGRFITITDSFITAWSSLRFVLLAVVMAITLVILYMLSQGQRRPLREVLPGVGGSLAAWMVLSMAFSYYVEHLGRYSVLYGSIATVIVVLLWLYMSGQILIKETDRRPLGRRGGRMKIIIVGCGKVGYAIAQQLTQEKHDITVVDDEAAHLNRADSTLDVLCIHGNGASISVLMEAGARDADLVIAVTGVDETNLVCALIAKSVGAQHTIARVRNPEYRRDADMLKREIGLDMLINPDLAAAQEIARILSFPAAISVEPFAGGRIDMIGFQLHPEDTILGRSLSDFHRERVAEVLICAAQRGDEFIIPNGAFVPQLEDRLYMVGSKAELHKMLKSMGRSLQRVKDVSILGGSRISMYLSWELARAGTRVHVVEQDHDKCLRLSQDLPGAMIIEGDGTDIDLIKSENLFGTDGFVALTGRDEENLLMALAARRAGVRKVLAKMTRPNYMELVQETGLGSIISPKDIIANQITRYVRALANSQGMAVESLYKLLGGKVEALEFTASNDGNGILHTPLMKLPLRHGVLLAAIVREGRTIIPGGMTTIEPGDHVLVVTNVPGLTDLKNILA